MTSQGLKFALILLAVLALASLVACSNVQPVATTVAAATPSPSETPARPAPSGSSLPRPGGPGGGSPSPIIPVVPANTVQGSGTITIAQDANLSFDTGGKIGQLSVKQGDRVTRGAVLAKLDTSSLEAAVAQAKVNLDQAVLAQTNAALALQTAQFNLDKTQAVSNIKDVITNIEWEIKVAQMNASSAATGTDPTFWARQLQQYQKDLTAEKKVLSDLLSGSAYTGAVTYDVMGQPYDRLTVEDMRSKEIQVQVAQQTLDRAQDVIDQAQKNLDLAQKQLNNATITAPFDGLIATVNVKVGDTVSAPTQNTRPIIYMIDPASLQIVLVVNELDTPQVKIGQKATVSVDAFPNVKLEAKVTGISALPDIQGGVVNYDVTISFTAPPSIDIRSGMNAAAMITTS